MSDFIDFEIPKNWRSLATPYSIAKAKKLWEELGKGIFLNDECPLQPGGVDIILDKQKCFHLPMKFVVLKKYPLPIEIVNLK